MGARLECVSILLASPRRLRRPGESCISAAFPLTGDEGSAAGPPCPDPGSGSSHFQVLLLRERPGRPDSLGGGSEPLCFRNVKRGSFPSPGACWGSANKTGVACSPSLHQRSACLSFCPSFPSEMQRKGNSRARNRVLPRCWPLGCSFPVVRRQGWASRQNPQGRFWPPHSVAPSCCL